MTQRRCLGRKQKAAVSSGFERQEGLANRAAKVGPDTSAGANQTLQLPTPRRVARHAGNAPHGPEHAHELPERLRVGENVRIGIV
jgi:hypothetical protein